MGRCVRTKHCAGPLQVRRNLLENAQPLAAHRRFEILEAGDVTTRLGYAGYESAVDRLGDLSEHDRNRAWELMKLCQSRIARDNDRVRRRLHQVCRQSLSVGSISATPAVIESDIAVFAPA